MLKILGYINNDLKKITLNELSEEYSLIWIDCYAPSDDELLQLSKKIDIEIEELKVGLDEQEVPRVEEEDEYYLIIYKAPLFEEDITTTSFGIYIKDNIILTLHIDKIKSIGKIYNLLKTKKPKILLDRGKGFFLYNLLNQITLSYSKIILNLEDELDKLESNLLQDQNNITGEILQLRKTLVYFHKALVSNKDVLSILKRKYLPITTQDDREHIEDLYYDTLQLIDMETTYRELLVSMMDMSLSLENIRMNQIMKVLTMVTTLFAVPVWITGIYGMNFKYMPLLNNPYGFWIVMGISAIIILILLYVFLKEKWIK
ncbi:magnesium/cobalt transporter CorA [Methanothermococcus okinawensis]|uniref:Magnesium transport protein CorA n=1 Tax=Methanothermococcus okinawensis (strain DSM 14208 / JCM 11175 / IH1) TaxID=647113 RepID=F8ALJ9_METOI|nr:magnesium/cobalt transporter CorA [Methanothermococcus okinawensis]AEH07160.1 magnesium and cobalt transport protein CorA [Methanothermococcus okinawensis IH1]